MLLSGCSSTSHASTTTVKPHHSSLTSCGTVKPRFIGIPDTLPESARFVFLFGPGPKDATVKGTIDPCDASWLVYEEESPSVGNAMGYGHLVNGNWVSIDLGTAQVGVGTVPDRVRADLPIAPFG